MRISMWTSFLFEEGPEGAVRTLREHGYECAELSDEHGKMLLDRGDPERTGREFKAFCDSLGFTLPQGHFSLHAAIDHADPARRRKEIDGLKRWCVLFNALGIKAGVLHPAGLKTEGRANLPLIADALQELLEFSDGMSFTICLENLIVSFGSFEELDELIRQVPSGERLGICLDTGHLSWNGGSPAEFARKAGGRLRALHITDCLMAGDARFDHIFPYSLGNIDWPELIHALREIRYGGIFNYEVPRERRAPPPILRAKLDYGLALGKEMLKL